MKTILLVDDVPEQLRSLKIGLSSNGYKTLETLSGRAALERLEDHQFQIDMVITDFSMPDMDGMELLKRIRNRSRSIPVIIMTAYSEKSLVIEALKNQCDSFIEKPFTLEDLIREIERIEYLRLRNIDSHDMARLVPRLVHQINNPLAAIRGHAELGVFGHGEDDVLKKRFESIVKAVDAITGINRQIIQLGASQEEQREKVDLVDLMEDCLGLFSGLMALKRVEVERDFEQGPVYTDGFSNVLEQAFKNLILNAIDALDGRPVKMLKVKIERREDIFMAMVRIEDNGWGISVENRRKIFEPYFTSKPHGNGLGLTVVREALRKHRGEVTVESRENVGTCINIRLPLDVPALTMERRKQDVRCENLVGIG